MRCPSRLVVAPQMGGWGFCRGLGSTRRLGIDHVGGAYQDALRPKGVGQVLAVGHAVLEGQDGCVAAHHWPDGLDSFVGGVALDGEEDQVWLPGAVGGR